MVKYKQNFMKDRGLCPGDVVLCEECGRVANDIHHKLKKSQGGTDDADNLIALCRRCHGAEHGIKVIEHG